MAEAAPTKAPDKRDVQLNPSRFLPLEHLAVTYGVTVEQGTTPADILKPVFWSHVAAKLRPYDEITVRTDDGVWYAKVLVLSAGRTWAKVKILAEHQLTATDTDLTHASQIEGYEVKYRGPHLKWGVVRTADSSALKEGCDSEEEARTWLRDFANNALA